MLVRSAPLAALAGCATLLVAAAVAHAQTPEAPADTQAQDAEARDLYERGRTLAAAERWGEALEYFRRARALRERPSVVYSIGTCLFTLGRYVEATAALTDFLRIADPERDAEQRGRATEMMAESQASIATLHLRVAPPSAALRLDGRPLADGTGATRTIALDPGEHLVHVSAPGHRAGDLRLSVLRGQRLEHTVELHALPSPGVRPPGRTPTLDPSRTSPSSERGRRRPPASDDRGSGGVLASPVFWVIVGVVAVGGGVAVGAALYDPGTEPPLQGTDGVVATLGRR